MKLDIIQNCPDVMRDFLTYSETIKGKSSLSVEEYYHDLSCFYKYLLVVRGIVDKNTEYKNIDINLVDIKLLSTVTISDLYAFMVYCKEERKNKSAARARKTSTLRIYFKYMSLQTNRLEHNPAELLNSPKVKQALPKYLSLENSLDLLNSVDGPNQKRDYAILTLFLNCGLRLAELCSLNLTSIYDEKMTVIGKGNKERIIYLNQSCVDAINDYLTVRPNNDIIAEDRNALFISRNRRRISNKTVQHIVYQYLEKAGLKDMGFSVHKLRHTAATLMYQYGKVDINVLKDILGHENLGTTQIYTHVSSEQMKKAVESNPLSKIK